MTKNTALTMIVRNEARNLPRCLESVGDLVDERIIVDTGSTDRTIEIARAHDATVILAAWPDSFAAARNISLDHCTAKWVFWMDADEYLAEPDRLRLKALLERLPDRNAAYVMTQRSAPSSAEVIATRVDHLRLFRHESHHRWQHRVHEQILPSLRSSGADVLWTDIVIEHTGYLNHEQLREKWTRNERLLELDLAEWPNDPHILLHLGMLHRERGNPAIAIPYLETALRQLRPEESASATVRAEHARCAREAGNLSTALASVLIGRRQHPDSPELIAEECEIHWLRRDWAATEACLLQLLSGPPATGFRSNVEGQQSAIPRHKLAVLRLEQGRWDEAEQLWQQVLFELPEFLQAKRGLKELSRRRGGP